MLTMWRKKLMSRWQMFSNNPTGRNVGDCAVRAVSLALDTDWETAYALIAMNGYLMGDVISSNAVFGSVLRQHGFSRYAIPNTCPDCYTVGDFADDHPEGVYVVGTGNHVCTIKDGIVMDSWDSRKEVPVYYWSRKEND